MTILTAANWSTHVRLFGQSGSLSRELVSSRHSLLTDLESRAEQHCDTQLPLCPFPFLFLLSVCTSSTVHCWLLAIREYQMLSVLVATAVDEKRALSSIWARCTGRCEFLSWRWMWCFAMSTIWTVIRLYVCISWSVWIQLIHIMCSFFQLTKYYREREKEKREQICLSVIR